MSSVVLHLAESASRPPSLRRVGRLLVELPGLIREAVLPALKRRSALRGGVPAWLQTASQPGLETIEPATATFQTIRLSLPILGSAAPEEFQQRTLFPELRPDPRDTGLDLLIDLVVRLEQRQDNLRDVSTNALRRFVRIQATLAEGSEIVAIELRSPRRPLSAQITRELTTLSSTLLASRPTETHVQVVGWIERLEVDENRFGITTDRGERIWCYWDNPRLPLMHWLWNDRVRVSGQGLFRADGKLKQITVSEFTPTHPGASRMWEDVIDANLNN
jgi:hypothetical protein